MPTVTHEPFELLDGTLADRLRALEFFARERVTGTMQGTNRSTLKGFAADFLQHRQYYPGDNLKYLDWRVYGKSDRLVVREYEELTNAQLTVVLDISGSMRTNGTSSGLSKHQYAVRHAAILLYLAALQHDQFSLAFFRTDRVQHLPFRSGRSHLLRAYTALLEPQAEGGTNFSAGIAKSTQHVRRRGLTVVLSDFMGDPATIVRQLAALRYRGSDVVAFQLYDPSETDLDFNTVTRFHDAESDAVLVVDPVLMRQAYREVFAQHQTEMRAACRQQGFDHVLLPLGEPVERPLFDYLRWRMGHQ